MIAGNSGEEKNKHASVVVSGGRGRLFRNRD
jgi:hypothetical protein